MVIKPVNGLHAEYYDNGQKQVEKNYKDGVCISGC